MSWDILCRVVDNHGDLGVCWRLAADLARRGKQVRLWCDDASALAWMAPQGQAGVQVHPWPTAVPAGGLGTVVVEAFGCEPPAAWLQAFGAAARPPVWINLEYLSAEAYVARCHALPSPLMSGPAAGRTRWFYYPGFTPATGGLLREPDLLPRQAGFDVQAWRRQEGLADGALAVSLFCYEPPALQALLQRLADAGARLLVTPGRAAAAVRALPPPAGLRLHWLQPRPQPEFDALLWGADLNFVRGEDSLVRALWAGQPFVWQIYPQDDGAHHEKLQAFLDWLQAPASLRQAHAAWNGLAGTALPPLGPAQLREWRACVQSARKSLLDQPDLVGQLLQFVAERS
ncbi:elongation factor P maturation arginine rhamnosyltransferase EarP [Pseudorhodoferax sp.]|uniref:elongation factor P maturation arginine rhamnosyltransferase EarP n=1 Tax=Pseudorhodoferax sp. TaxID=1993553 RepID=UPI002DD6816F|nr:elongation factor P maturation arginine rhamnosyltransferase EarP [Pseudorhodoferax sp.]